MAAAVMVKEATILSATQTARSAALNKGQRLEIFCTGEDASSRRPAISPAE
jgi:hypothetical protein